MQDVRSADEFFGGVGQLFVGLIFNIPIDSSGRSSLHGF